MAQNDLVIHLLNDGSGNWGVVCIDAPAVDPSGGDRLAVPNFGNSTQTGSPITITAASNATPIVLTVASGHGLVTGDFIYVQGVGGNTAANGTFETSVSSNSVTLLDSVGNGSYTSGGTCQKLATNKNLKEVLSIAEAVILDWKAAGN